MSDQQPHIFHGPSEERRYVTIEEHNETKARVSKLEKWMWFVSGAAAVVSYLLGASGLVTKLFQ